MAWQSKFSELWTVYADETAIEYRHGGVWKHEEYGQARTDVRAESTNEPLRRPAMEVDHQTPRVETVSTVIRSGHQSCTSRSLPPPTSAISVRNEILPTYMY